MPKKYRFNGNQGKKFLRDYVKNKIDKDVSERFKKGIGTNFIDNESNSKRLNIEDTIMNTDFFSYFPFKTSF